MKALDAAAGLDANDGVGDGVIIITEPILAGNYASWPNKR